MPFALGVYQKENNLQAHALAYLQARPEITWAARFNSGAHSTGSGKARRFIRYAFPGCSDILGQFNSGHFFAIELKVNHRKASEKQAAFIDLVNLGGGMGLVAWSIDDIADALESFLLRTPAPLQHPDVTALRRALGI